MDYKKLWLLLTLLITAPLALAHPMGNFSVNHYSKIEVTNSNVVIRYFIDLAEIPTYQELQHGNITPSADKPIDQNGTVVTQYVSGRGRELGRGLSLMIDGKAMPLRMVSSSVIFPPGAGGLPTMKMGFVYEAKYPAGIDRQHLDLHYADGNYPGQSGWKEIIALTTAGSLATSSVPSSDRSAELTNYPTDLLSSPPQNLEAAFQASLPPMPEAPSTTAGTSRSKVVATSSSPVERDTRINRKAAQATRNKTKQSAPSIPAIQAAAVDRPAVQLVGNQEKTPRSKFTELITEQHLSLWFLFTAAFIAVGLGGLHALEPGHGKTVVAAYLVGSRGTARHAVLLGLIVTASHTIGVFALGAITLYASRYIVPEQLYPWLGVFSGITIAVLGLYMFLRRWTGTASDHSHAPGSPQSHWFFSKRESGQREPAEASSLAPVELQRVSFTQLFTLGITGGIIPCPAALIVLLSAFALHRIALGFFLIVAFSVGLAAVLIGFGMVMVYARRFIARLQVDGPLTRRWLPIASSAFVTILGVGLAIQSFATTHFRIQAFSKAHIGPLLFVAGLGLFLGMRHSTDADHVVAISTIVSRQRGIRNAAFIGSVWGLGHTITIFVVGSLIILFGVTIPARLGLSMEFSVALMLIILGVLNLTGVMQTLTARLTPARFAKLNVQDNVAMPGALAKDRSLEGSIAHLGLYQLLRPLVIGLIHGLAGSAAVALLVLSTIHDPHWATLYLVIFGFGTMIGMMCMTAAIAVPLTYAGDRFTKLSHYFGIASGLVSVCFGSFLVYQLGFVGGLFSSHPQWTPQ